MQRNSAQPSHLRRRYQAFQEQKQRDGFKFSGDDTRLDGPNSLELSMHLPSDPYRNRFDILTDPSPPQSYSSTGSHRVGPYPRRYRHSRGTKEAKRRRDARRNKRKLLAAQELDAQLSETIDKTLTTANIYRPPQLRLPAPKPAPPTLAIEHPQPVHMPPTPPQIPYLNFGGFDLLRDFPQLAKYSASSAPLSPPLYTPQVPTWCPAIPSITSKKGSEDDLPLFFDLSSLPEPFQTPRARPVPALTPACQELQLWLPKRNPQPVKHSRFFPPRQTSPAPKVNLPPTTCVLHKSDKGVQVDLPPRSQPTLQSQTQIQQAIDSLEKTVANEHHEPSAANLWRILTSTDKTYRDVGTDAYVGSFASKLPEDPLSMPHGIFDTRMEAVGMPAELDSTEVPYVHANCLTGQGNERAEYQQREAEEHRTVIYDSPMAMTPVENMYAGLNELIVDHDVANDGRESHALIAEHDCYDEDERRYWDA